LGAERRGGFAQVGFVEVGERELAALGCELLRQRPADARAGAGDDGDLAVQVVHGIPPGMVRRCYSNDAVTGNSNIASRKCGSSNWLRPTNDVACRPDSRIAPGSGTPLTQSQ